MVCLRKIILIELDITVKKNAKTGGQSGGSGRWKWKGLNFWQWELRTVLTSACGAESSELGCQLNVGNKGEDESKELQGFNLGNPEKQGNGQEESCTLWYKHANQLAVT